MGEMQNRWVEGNPRFVACWAQGGSRAAAAAHLPGTVFRAAAVMPPPPPWAPAGALHAYREALILWSGPLGCMQQICPKHDIRVRERKENHGSD